MSVSKPHSSYEKAEDAVIHNYARRLSEALRRIDELEEQLEAARRDADQLGEQADLQGAENQRLREQLEANAKWMEGARELIEQLEAVRRLVAESSERSSMDTLDLLRGLFPLDNPRQPSNPASRQDG